MRAVPPSPIVGPAKNRPPLDFAARIGFSSVLIPFDRVVFVSHVQPDPDSLGSMLGLSHLVETRLDKPSVITRDGLISRAENRAMVDVLHLDLVPIEEVEWGPTTRW